MQATYLPNGSGKLKASPCLNGHSCLICCFKINCLTFKNAEVWLPSQQQTQAEAFQLLPFYGLEAPSEPPTVHVIIYSPSPRPLLLEVLFPGHGRLCALGFTHVVLEKHWPGLPAGSVCVHTYTHACLCLHGCAAIVPTKHVLSCADKPFPTSDIAQKV